MKTLTLPSPKSKEHRFRRGVKLLLIGVVIVTAREYARVTWDQVWRAEVIVLGLDEKPYVYRALVPWLAHLLVLLGLRADVALTVIVILSAIGLVYGIKYLLAAFRRS
jgi:hypothetical protein